MSYKLNKTDGTILTDLVDGTVDSTSSDLTLIGRNYSVLGEFLNEKQLELLIDKSKTDSSDIEEIEIIESSSLSSDLLLD